MRPLIAHCHLGLGTLYKRVGERDRGHEHLGIATTMYREMGMQLATPGRAGIGDREGPGLS
jgi:hypothetical protein